MTRRSTKSIHFEIPLKLYEELYKEFPERGAIKILLTRLIEFAVEGAQNKDCFARGVYEEALATYDDGKEDW